MSRTKAGACACAKHEPISVGVCCGLSRGRGRKRLVAQRLSSLSEQRACIRARTRRIGKLSRAWAFERIAANLDLALNITGLAADAVDSLKLIVVRLQLVVCDAPILT